MGPMWHQGEDTTALFLGAGHIDGPVTPMAFEVPQPCFLEAQDGDYRLLTVEDYMLQPLYNAYGENASIVTEHYKLPHKKAVFLSAEFAAPSIDVASLAPLEVH